MARKSIKELKNNTTPLLFLDFLKKQLGDEAYILLERLSYVSNVLIFSGIIRNYFINYFGKVRDFDLVVDCDYNTLEEILRYYPFRKNSFGGYKVDVKGLNVDIWNITTTWAFVNKKLDAKLFLKESLPQTTFFNFSAIVFDFNAKKFLWESDFEEFLSKGAIDLVLEDNPLPQLCIVNTIYYKHKYHLEVSKRLESYCLANFTKYSEKDFKDIQLKHFGELKFSYDYLKEYMHIFNKDTDK
ncbi:hypothetical protein [Pedobacter helvus]|uniref:Poly A polymerase head domain-containing protein n=1 Tax=Pedobacter helvus TaxID=2563444 RepID=A0ABW9JL92_9SPHI|nr:hypothetical protein [Pedobacter ureilyticus]